jgi:hypothetical protein
MPGAWRGLRCKDTYFGLSMDNYSSSCYNKIVTNHRGQSARRLDGRAPLGVIRTIS